MERIENMPAPVPRMYADELLQEISNAYDDAVALSQQYTREGNKESAVNIAFYADGLRECRSKMEKMLKEC